MNEQERAQQLMDWIDENWGSFETSRGMTAGAMTQLRPPPDNEEQEWLMREWFQRRESEDASPVIGARGDAEGSTPEDRSPSGVDPDTGEIVDEEDIPFAVEEDEEPEPIVSVPSTELVPTGELVSVFGRGGPEQALAAVEAYATAMRNFITAHDLALEMEDGSLYVTAPGVEATGQLTGWFAEVEWTERVEGGWKARAYAHQPGTGRRSASREAVCTRSEKGKQWKSESDLLSLAQTRACRKALGATLSIIWNAAGYESAAPEEKPHTPKQRAMLFALLAQLQTVKAKRKVGNEDGWKHWASQGTLARYGKRISGLNRAEMTEAIERVKQVHEALTSNGDDGYEPSSDELAEAEAIEFG
jgi:hypothetical protein